MKDPMARVYLGEVYVGLIYEQGGAMYYEAPSGEVGSGQDILSRNRYLSRAELQTAIRYLVPEPARQYMKFIEISAREKINSAKAK